jgi:hypothetical protein
MTMPSYSDVFSIVLDREHDEDIQAGDIVRTGENLHPHFTVVAISGDKAWLRNLQSGADSLGLLSRCRKIETATPALAFAAE